MSMQELDNFIRQYFQLLSITARVRQTSQSLMTLLEHVRAQLDSLSLGHLSPSIMTPNYLREILTKIQTELPHHLRLPSVQGGPARTFLAAPSPLSLLLFKFVVVSMFSWSSLLFFFFFFANVGDTDVVDVVDVAVVFVVGVCGPFLVVGVAACSAAAAAATGSGALVCF